MKKNYELKCYEGDHPRILVTEEIILKNKFTLKRSEKEIFERIENAEGFDFAGGVLYNYLPWRKAKVGYTEEFVKKIENGKKKKPRKITDIYETTQDLLDYLIFGYMKALDERGISASRTISKLRHWLWLLGRDDLVKILDNDNLYNPYGMPMLIELTKQLGLDVPENCIEFAKHKC